MMTELPGSSYLFALATVSITFVGFSALLVVIRQGMGGRLKEYDIYFTLSFVQIGFIVTGSSLVPPLLWLYEWPVAVVWRLASAIIALPVLWFVATVPRRRRAATGARTP